jgi:hypothetical protein
MSTNKKQLTQQELLNSLTNADENQNKENSSEQLVEREPIEGTPFYMMGNNEKGYSVVMANYKLSPVQPTKEDVLRYMNDNLWNFTINVIHVCMELKDYVNQQKNLQ